MIALWAYLLKKIRHSHGDISESAAAGIVGLSISQFSLRFRDLTGNTFRQAQVEIRVLRAMELLQTNRDIAEIAEMLGYSERSNLEKTFKRLIGMTPACYRRKHHKKSDHRLPHFPSLSSRPKRKTRKKES